jgi:PKD repeat protein
MNIKKGGLRILIIFFISILVNNSFIGIYTGQENQIKSNIFKINSIPSYLKVGDILFCDVKPKIVEYLRNIDPDPYSYIDVPGFSNDHCAMYIGHNWFIEAAPYRLRPLRANWLGVVIGPFWKIKLWATNFTYVYVNTSQKIRNKAVQWAKTQLGQPYQQVVWEGANSDPHDSSDKYSNYWYCSELIWASYFNQDLKLIVDQGENSHSIKTILDLKYADQVIWYKNEPPIANSGGPYEGFVNESVYFDGSNSNDVDGQIMIYNWSYGDGNYGYSEYHEYTEAEIYSVTLTVKDGGGKYASDKTTVTIRNKNKQPTTPDFQGITSGYTNKIYDFTIFSNDPDDDSIKYIINWDDGIKETSDYLPNGRIFNISHKWSTPGSYNIHIEATDGDLISSYSRNIDMIENQPNSPENNNLIIFQVVLIFIAIIGFMMLLIILKRRLS